MASSSSFQGREVTCVCVCMCTCAHITLPTCIGCCRNVTAICCYGYKYGAMGSKLSTFQCQCMYCEGQWLLGDSSSVPRVHQANVAMQEAPGSIPNFIPKMFYSKYMYSYACSN